MSERRRHGFHEYHPARERLLLKIINGEHDEERETPEQTAIIQEWISKLENDLSARTRYRRTPAERERRKRQRRIPFVVRVKRL